MSLPDLQQVLATVRLLGADSEAYRQLLAQVIALFGPADQEHLKAEYERAIAQSDRLHADIQRGADA